MKQFFTCFFLFTSLLYMVLITDINVKKMKRYIQVLFKSILIITLLVNITYSIPTNKVNIDINHISQNKIEIIFSLDTLIIQTIEKKDQTVTNFDLPSLTQSAIPGEPVLPLLVKQFNVNPENIQATVNIERATQYSLPSPVEQFQDIAKGAQLKTDDKNDTITNNYPNQILTTQFSGYYRQSPVTTLNFFPIQILSKQTIKVIQKARITVIFNQSDLRISRETKPGLFTNLKIGKISKPLSKSTTAPIMMNEPYLKLIVSEDGVYRLNYQQLKEMDIPLSQIDPEQFALYNRGKQVPLYIYGEKDNQFHKQDYIEFIGRRNPNSTGNSSKYDPFTDDNVYQLFWNIDNGLRFARESASPDYQGQDLIKPVEYDYLFRFEENQKFQRLGFVYTNELSSKNDQYFFNKQILSGTSEDFDFYLPSPNENTTKNIAVKVKLQSLAQHIYSTAHILINGQNIGKGTWYWNNPGYIEQNPEFYIPNNFLREGKNTLTINLEHNPNDQSSSIVLDWLEIQYYRSFTANNNYIEFNKPSDQINGYYQFDIDNFSDGDITIYKNGLTKISDFQKSYSEKSDRYSIRLQDEIHGPTNFLAAAGDKITAPDTCYIDTVKNLLDFEGCEHLLIVADDFYETSKELVDFYAEKNIHCHRVKISDIYNQFNFGIKSPFAIRNFLKQALQHWTKFPKWALLIGDANLDNPEKDLIPTVMYQTFKWGGSASDYWYALLDGDDNIPDIHLGRWACGSIPELETMIQKRINYENEQPAGPWRDRHLYIAGKENIFKTQTDYITKNLNKTPIIIDRILINPSNVASRFFGGTDTLITRINQGLKLINFVGHGGGAVWADRSLFRLEDLYKLRNGNKLPFISSLTCFTADFAAQQSLGESITERFNSGAIGLWGSSGVGWIINDFLLGKELFKNIDAKDLSVGEIIDIAKINYLSQSHQYNYLKNSMIFQYNLLGDPAVRLSQPDEEKNYLSLDSQVIQPGDKINISGSLPFDEGKVDIQIYDSNKYPRTGLIPYYFTEKDFSQSIFLPDSSIEHGYINIYGTNSDQTQDFASALHFSSNSVYYKDLTLTPNSIDYGDSVNLTVTMTSAVDSVFWEIDTAAYKYISSESGIEDIYAFDEASESVHNIQCHSTDENRFATKQPFIPYQSNRYIAYRIAWYKKGDKKTGPIYIMDINEDFDIEMISLKQGGQKTPAIEAELFLHGNDTISASIDVYQSPYYTLTDSGTYDLVDSSIILTKQIKLFPGKQSIIELPVIAGNRTLEGLVYVTSNDDKENSTRNNSRTFDFKINHFSVTPTKGTSFSGEKNDTLFFDEDFFLHIPPGTISDSAVVKIEPFEIDEFKQPDFIPQLTADSTYQKYAVHFSQDILFTKPGNLGIRQADNSDIKLIKFYPALNIWQQQETDFNNSYFTSPFIAAGEFAIAEIKDTDLPEIEINFDGKRVDEQNYVDSHPMISFIFNDDNGINLTADGLSIFIDDNPVDFNELIIKDTLTIFNSVSCSYRSGLMSGRHKIKVSIEDAAKNITEDEYEFNIFKDLKILDYGNYPNPFKTRTWFVFETTKNVEEFKIDIYSSSGRKIRTIDDTNIYEDKALIESGYHEVSWDGKDDFGDNLANGVYYYRMVAKTNENTVFKKGVIAKVK